MSKKYEIYSGRRVVSTQYSSSATQAAVDYVRSQGIKDDEIRRLGVDLVSWRGAHYRAVLVPAEPQVGWVAAAQGLVVGDSAPASPELALVDADLAAELRRGLRAVEDTLLRSRVADEVPAAIEEDAPPQPVVADELPLAEPRESDHLPELDYIVEVVEEAPAPSRQTRSHYPVLPEPGAEAMEETDAALRLIREHMTEELPASERKLRRRFILASGVTALCAVGVLALDVQLQVAQLPDWLGF